VFSAIRCILDVNFQTKCPTAPNLKRGGVAPLGLTYNVCREGRIMRVAATAMRQRCQSHYITSPSQWHNSTAVRHPPVYTRWWDPPLLTSIHRHSVNPLSIIISISSSSSSRRIRLWLMIKWYNCSEETHLWATERHLPYGFTQCYLPPTHKRVLL